MLFILGNVFNNLESVAFLIDNMYFYFHKLMRYNSIIFFFNFNGIKYWKSSIFFLCVFAHKQ